MPSDPNTGEVKLANNNLNFTTGATAPFRYGDKVYFTVKVPKKSGIGMVSRLYSAIRDEAAIPQLINPKEEGINVAEATLSVGGDRIYYTACKESKGDKPTQSEIWYRDKLYDGSWGHVVMLPKSINDAGVINKQPTCGYDLKLKKEVLYFSSNRPGGKGGFDIWCCAIERDGTFGNPVNMPFNTANDEVTPFFYTHAQMIFFSSNMPSGLGGFDVYRTSKNAAGAWLAAENLSLANTSFDELYFSYHQPSQISYFCSTRPNQLNPESAGQFAIFMGKLTGSILLNTMSEMDSAALYGCNIELENIETGIIEATILRSENNNLELPIFPGKKYRLIISRPGYYPVFLQLESMYSDFANPIRKTVYLKPMR
ncbi:MAG: hypothetical protein K9J37_06990 [Saprospiraceae bacterium]|nr:hypothetical protein [Saprospiraceae bacterium]MCF8249641.1 hypothetical protein [Saprospiraceae bacterium]MCF8280451.1 hypothetical protein [Bacteroidales bacterium]MCF8310473.1 hypothetical protein [Saprospiraceae bacterium]MCF8439851.1 hypothetical protein [Saprospiraceae bacterium]